jgi:DNA-directed RNA polymerase specialized sigma24 family protein
MVIGNGFFSDTIEDALQEMKQRSCCDVVKLPFQTIGNIVYYIGCNGDLYGCQRIAGKILTRKKTHLRYKRGFTDRLSEDAHKEIFVHLENLVWSAFVSKRYEPELVIQFKNRNPYDVRPENLFISNDVCKREIYCNTIKRFASVYDSCFSHFCYSCQYFTGIDFEDAKDVVSGVFIYLCTDGYNQSIKNDGDFAGLWNKLSRQRSIDFLKHRWLNIYGGSENLRSKNKVSCEVDLFSVLKGEKRQKYMRMYFEGNKPMEIAKSFGVSPATVSSEITRGVQYLREYLKIPKNTHK